jgi:FAD/FMN-containing dehydrogenase
MVPSFAGRLYLRDSEGYEQARAGRVFNLRRPGRYPAAVLLASDSGDVVAGVRWAAACGWRVAVRAGGHSWAAWSVRDDVLLIDLGEFRSMSLDASTGIVTAGPAVRGGLDLDPYLAERGRFFAGGHCPTVGLGGFLLQGGMGWNARGWGWAAESIEAIDVVTADGSLVRASASENSDLFWAARGSGPGFCGVVTRFHLRTRPRFCAARHTAHVYPMDCFDEVMTWLSELHLTVSPDVEIVAVGMYPPAELGLPDEPVLVVTGLALSPDDASAVAALAPLETCPLLPRALAVKSAEPTTLAEQRAEQIRMNPEGHCYAVSNAYLDGPVASQVAALRAAFGTLPSRQTFVIWFSMGPQRALPDMALSLQTDAYFAAYVIWPPSSGDGESCSRWLAERMTELEPVTAGQYLGDSDFTVRQHRFMSDDAWRRFQAIRDARDPGRLFAGYLCADQATLNSPCS